MIFMKSKHKRAGKPKNFNGFKDFERDEAYSGPPKKNKNFKPEKHTKKRNRDDFYEEDDEQSSL